MREIILSLLFVCLAVSALAQNVPEIIENFDSGEITLLSWADEDLEPDAWSLDSVVTHDSSPYSLKLHGNTWKEQPIVPLQVEQNSVIEFSAMYQSGAKVQGIGFSDGENHIFYSISGSDILDLEEWIPVYQGAYNPNIWNQYRLPLGSDWESFFEYEPIISSIIYINDLDFVYASSVWFDSIMNITPIQAIAPQVTISTQTPVSRNEREVQIQFSAIIDDPDSEAWDYLWSFGDGNYSLEEAPLHFYQVADGHQYNVNLQVIDESGKVGLASTRVDIDEGPSSLPLTMNFVGDVMLARRYDTQVIPSLGIEAIFEPTYPMLGGAADVTIANLEVVLANTGTPHPTKSVVYRGNPANVSGLVYAGIDNVCLANNHTLDYGLPALQQTQDILDANSIGFSGAGVNSYEAYLPSFINRKGISVALLRSSDRTGQYNNAQPYLHAGFDKEGFAYMTPYYNMMQLAAVGEVADLKVIEMHAGSEYSLQPGADYGKSNPYLADTQDEDYFYRYDVPHQWDREIRHSAVDNGADLVIVHHPHIIQGLELYSGKVIAHSLGNFVFDLDYPECMPSMVFYVDAYPDGFRNHYVRPVYIDSYIPRPATGHLGLHILDYIAMKSRELDTIVIVDKEDLTAYVPLDPDNLATTLYPWEYEPDFEIHEQGYQKTAPIKLTRFGSISSIDKLEPAQDAEFRLGSELIWFGNFEDEGSSLWTPSEYSDQSIDGQRSAFFSSTGSGSQNSRISKKLKIYDNQKDYTLHGWIRTRNVGSASISIRYFSQRNSYYPISSQSISTDIVGTQPWTWFYKELSIPSNAWYYDVSLDFSGADLGISQAWFDNVGLIEWTPWQSGIDCPDIPHPNNYYWIQLQSQEAVKSLSLGITETAFRNSGEIRTRDRISPTIPVKIYPNPFNPDTNIRFSLNQRARTKLKVYNIRGQLIRDLLNEELDPGEHNVRWDGKDNQGRAVASGLLFVRIESGKLQVTRKAILLK